MHRKHAPDNFNSELECVLKLYDSSNEKKDSVDTIDFKKIFNTGNQLTRAFKKKGKLKRFDFIEFLEKQGVKIKEIIKNLQQFTEILASLTENDQLLFMLKVIDKNTIANWKIEYNLVEFLVNFDGNLDAVVKYLNDHGVATDLTDGAKKNRLASIPLVSRL